jgi:hypothetical protein
MKLQRSRNWLIGHYRAASLDQEDNDMTGQFMRRYVTVFGFIIAALSGAAVQAQDKANPVVVELFTSQGCSSCPPADAMLRELSHRDDVIPLALHVDYWDYIGWQDVFASPLFTRRQKQYARAAGEQAIYTPQLIVGGRDHVVGAKPMEVMDHLRAHGALASGVDLTLRRDGGTLHVSATAKSPLAAPATVQIVRYTPEETVAIERGENAGRTVTYTNIVTSWDVLGDWSGTQPLAIQVALAGGSPVVIIVQEAGPGLILAAARLR